MNASRIHLFSIEVVVTSKWLVRLGIVLILCSASSSVSAQNSRMPPSQLPENPSQQPEDDARSKMERDMAKKANQERQVALKKDTDKLLKLATELKEYVDKTNENMLSMDVIKKAEEIEKLAHSVRDKMKGN
jgi:predicted  nucleic acid-binding Zn-ribbon protein